VNINFAMLLVFGAFVLNFFQKIKPFLLGMLNQANLYADLN